MTHRQLCTGATVLLISAVGPHSLAAQKPYLPPLPEFSDSTPAAIMGSSGRFFRQDAALEVLRQRHRKYPAAKRRELEELVLRLAIDDPNYGTPTILALSMSGSSDRGIAGTPNPQALFSLIRISQGARSGDERNYALLSLIDQIKPARALPYLRQVATTSPEEWVPWSAVREIDRLAYGLCTSRADASERAQAKSLLRELYDQHLVKGRAAMEMCRMAAFRRWPSAAWCPRIVM